MESEYESATDSETELEATPEEFEHNNNKITDMFRWLLILILTWQIGHCISVAAIGELLQFIAKAFSLAESLLSSPVVIGLSAFPTSIYLAHKYLKIERDNFIKYVLCPKCHTLYNYEEMMKPESVIGIKSCTFVKFPLHPQKNGRLPCNAPIVRPINLSNNSKRLYALHLYVSKRLHDAIQRILLRDNIHVKMEAWRNRRVPDDFYADVYDGRVWKSFMDKLLKHKRSLAFMINVDWFQPFKTLYRFIGCYILDNS